MAGSNPKLAIKIGRALIITHDYSGAIKYYKKSLKRGENFELRLEMADLLKKLKRVDEAESILLEGTEHSTRNEFYFNSNELPSPPMATWTIFILDGHAIGIEI